jgi:hypothetical protein
MAGRPSAKEGRRGTMNGPWPVGLGIRPCQMALSGVLPPLATSVSDDCLTIGFGLRVVRGGTILSFLRRFRVMRAKNGRTGETLSLTQNVGPTSGSAPTRFGCRKSHNTATQFMQSHMEGNTPAKRKRGPSGAFAGTAGVAASLAGDWGHDFTRTRSLRAPAWPIARKCKPDRDGTWRPRRDGRRPTADGRSPRG